MRMMMRMMLLSRCWLVLRHRPKPRVDTVLAYYEHITGGESHVMILIMSELYLIVEGSAL